MTRLPLSNSNTHQYSQAPSVKTLDVSKKVQSDIDISRTHQSDTDISRKPQSPHLEILISHVLDTDILFRTWS